MPLTHVCVWDSKQGYRRITVEEALSVCPPYTIHVDDKYFRFVCEICAQSIGFSKTRKDTGTRYFYHSRGEQDKECEDRQRVRNQVPAALNSHVMPMRIKQIGGSYHFQLGLFFPKKDDSHRPGFESVIIRGAGNQAYEYSFERIRTAGITYLDVGEQPSQTYRLEFVCPSGDAGRYWPSTIPGINPWGAIFELDSGKMLHVGGKAYAGQAYYLLQNQPVRCPHGLSLREVTHLRAGMVTWYLYRVDIETFCEEAARFFLQRSVSLTESRTELYPIWPVCKRAPYFIYHNQSSLYFFMDGDTSELKLHPVSNAYYEPKLQKVGQGALVRIHTLEKEQLLSMGVSGALGFSYLLKKELSMQASVPAVSVKDLAGTALEQDVFITLPKTGQVIVSASFDGKIVLSRDGAIREIYGLTPSQPLIVDSLSFGTVIEIYQGCDCVRMQKRASGIVGDFMEDIFGKELKPWQANENPAKELFV